MTLRPAYDYVIVGGGSAGCVLAYRLSEDPANAVLLVESGPDDRNRLIDMPLGIGKLMRPRPGGKTYHTVYSISPGGNRPPEIWLKGSTLGGSSSINGMVYVRGMPSDYDGWEATGCPGWGWATVGRCFKEMEHHALGPAEWRGDAGPLRISMSRLDAVGRATVAAAVQAGARAVPDINDYDAAMHGGVGPQPATIWGGRRFSAARAFLRPAQTRANLDVVTDTAALGITFDGRRATGVRLRSPEGEHAVAARREVILSAGAIHSPKLLQLAGIGPAGLLRSLGIDVRVDAQEVGRNGQEHRTIKIMFDLKRGGRARELTGAGLGISALKYALAGRGVLSSCIWEVGGLVKTLPDLAEPDCQIGVTYFAHDANGVRRTPAMQVFGYVLRPRSRSEIMLASADPAAPPAIVANYLTDPYDREHTISLFRWIRTLAAQPALARYVAAETLPGPQADSDEALVEASFEQAGAAAHISGTCRMGTDAGAVLDPDLRVRGIDGLRVVDTSIMPTLVSGNTNGPVMALAWHAAERILAAA